MPASRSTLSMFAATHAVLCALLLLVGACATDPGAGVPEDEDSGRTVSDAGRTPQDAGSDAAPDAGDAGAGANDAIAPGQPYLELVGDSEVRLSYSQSTDLDVRLIGGDGSPIADENLRYALDELRAGGSGLRSLNARTDAEGVASVTLLAGNVTAEFEVSVEAPDTEGVQPIQIPVTVAPKDAADYVIQVLYPSNAIALQDVEVFLFNTPGTCRALDRDPDAVFGALDLLDIVPSVDGMFPPYEYEARLEDLPLTYAVAVGYKEDTAVTFGCTDNLPADIVAGDNTVVDIELGELFPDIQGEFNVTTQFDLLEFLPEQVETVVDIIAEFFDSPGSAVFSILEETGVLERGDFPFGLDTLLVEAIDGLLFAFLPEEALVVFETGSDIFATLRDIKLRGSMVFFENPDSLGNLGPCNEIILDDIIVAFDTIETPPLNLRSYGYQAAYGEFSGWISVVDEGDVAYQLNVSQFGLELNYGELAVFILEAVVFPNVIGPEIDSMEAFVASFIDCEAIAEDIGWGGLEGICDIAIDATVDGLRGLLTEQTVDVGSFYVLQTPAFGSTPPADVQLLETGLEWGPCDISVDTDAGDFSVELLGGSGADRCVWDARFRTSTDDPAGSPVSAAFDGFRLQSRVPGTCGDGQ